MMFNLIMIIYNIVKLIYSDMIIKKIVYNWQTGGGIVIEISHNLAKTIFRLYYCTLKRKKLFGRHDCFKKLEFTINLF